MNVPLLAAAALGATSVYQVIRPQTASSLAKNLEKCNQRHCAPAEQIFIDKPINTLMRDDRGTARTTQQIYQQQKRQFRREAAQSPGVNLVAHSVV